jgi:hypothetical protein
MANTVAKALGSHALRWSAAAVVTATLGTAGMAYAHDPRLDEADAALVQAETLLLASQPGAVSTQVEREFERDIKRALDLLERVRERIAAAAAAVDAQ